MMSTKNENVKNEVVVKESTALEITDEQMNALLEQELNNTMQMGGFDYRPGKIGIMHREKCFITPDRQTVTSINGTIVYFHKARGYWQEEGQQIPTCSSMDGKTGTRRISEDGTDTEMVNCANCPYNQFGSDPKGGAGKACKEMRRLFIVEQDSILPAILNVPPTSLKAFDQFISGLVSKKKVHIAYETVFRLEGAKAAGFDYSKVTLELGEKHPNEKIFELLKMREQVVEAAKNIAIEMDDYVNESAEGQTLRDDGEVY
ncbi:MAG: hypothetical protein PHE26_10900 [Syntrophomonadaceae bacterium]|nr:hypothetical protein [Syntrophomonadaceae bacterium]